MDEFTALIRQQAADALVRTFHQAATPESDPILELIGMLLGDDAGSSEPPAESALSLDQWLMWNELALTRPKELVAAMTSVLERERINLPSEQAAMRTWAASLVLNTLDQLEML